MKKYILALAALAMLASSCVKDEVYKSDEEGDMTDYSVLAINEIEGTGDDADKYIEIYNKSATETINLNNVKLLYQGSETWSGNTAQEIGPGQIFLVKGTKGTGMMSAGLSSTQAITVELRNPTNGRIDYFEKPDTAAEGKRNISRIPDGTGPWYYSPVGEGKTEGATNGTSTTGKTPVNPV